MASDQQFCLRWNNHQSTLVSVFDNLLESQTLVDCTLAADGQYLKAHKVVLSACSPYLEAILCQNLDKHPILILKDVKFSELKAMLDYMYRGEVNISQEQLSTFLKAAESLQIKGLTDSGGGGNSDRDRDRDREPLKRQDLRKPLNQPVPHIPQPRPVVPHPGLMERRSLPHFPPHIADMQPQSPRHAREGSTSPTARKRRRPNRPSSDDSNFVSTPNSLSENQPDTSDSCDVPVKQAASSTPNVPNATTKAPETDSNRTTPQPQNNQLNSEQKQQQVTVKKEFSEALLTPKTEFDYGNDNSMEDVTYEDDEEEEVDLSKPGTSFAANSQGFPPWQMGGDGSNDDSNNMYSPDVTAATNQNNSQGQMTGRPSGKSPRSKESLQSKKTRSRTSSQEISKPLRGSQHLQDSTPKSESNSTKSKKSKGTNSKGHSRTNGPSGKRVVCPKCGEYILKRVVRLHKKYYCGKQFEENEWKIVSGSALCLRCHKIQEPNSIEFHVKYLCGKKPITVQCFYCPLLIQDYKLLLGHMNGAHRKKHCFLDLISVLPTADFVGSANSTPKIVKNFFNMLHTEQEALVAENEVSSFVQLRYKTTHKCETCGKVILGSREYFNHVNTQCESVKCYACFYCDFKSALVYEVLDHMEDNHGKVFNTFDIIQARLTGIIPLSCQQPIDYVDKQNEPLESKTHSFPGENIKRSDETQDISKPALTKEKVSPANDDVTKKFEVVNGQMFVKGYPSQKESTVQEKLVHNSNVDIPKDTDPKQDVSGFNNVSIDDIQDRQFCPSSSLGKESENITMTQKEKLNELNVCSIKKRLSEETSVVPSTEPVFDANHSAFAESKSAENDLTELLLENDIVPQSMADDLKVDESLIECTSQEIQKPRFSPRTKLREVNINEGPKSPKQIKTIKSPSSVVVAENKCLNADPEVEFANNQLFEPYFSPSVVSQTIQNHVENSKRKNKSKFDKFKENSNLDENDSGKNMSSDSEVDFANNELFEPYVSPKKDLRSTRHKCAAVKNEKGIKVESLRKKGESSQTGKKVTKPQTDQIKLRKKFRNKVSLKVGKKKTVIGSLLKK